MMASSIENLSSGARELADLLAEPHRRLALQVLSEGTAPLALADLATEIAAREEDEPAYTVDQDRTKRVLVSLYHCHIPKLSDAGVVDYDATRRTVELSDTGQSAPMRREMTLGE